MSATVLPAPAREIDHPEAERTDDAGMTRAVKLGTFIGIPAVFIVTGSMGLLGGAGVVASAAIATWTSFFGGGMYLGGVFFLPRGHEHFERPPEWPTVASARVKAEVAAAEKTG